jgi:hypothetical protein
MSLSRTFYRRPILARPAMNTQFTIALSLSCNAKKASICTDVFETGRAFACGNFKSLIGLVFLENNYGDISPGTYV